MGIQIFISYRRSDAPADTGRIYEKLAREFGARNVFKDLDSISPGEDFDAKINEALSSSDVFLLIVGKRWLTETDKTGARRIDDPEDYVRKELLVAKKNGVRLIPLLVDNATMPAANELPSELEFLSKRNALPIRNDPDFSRDIDALITLISRRRRKLMIAALFAFLFFAAGTSTGFYAGRLTSEQPWSTEQSQAELVERSIATPPVDNPESVETEPAQSRVRIALIIANKSYQTQSPLLNSVNDAEAVAECLKSKGFRLQPLQIDKSTDDLRSALIDFRTLLALGGTGIVFYSGHGMQIDNENFIIPIDSAATTIDDIRMTCINVSEIMGPIDKILEDTPERSGDLVIFSTSSGGTALDAYGSSHHSPFTKCFLDAAAVNEYEFFDLFRYLCEHVPKNTDGRQIPWMSVSTNVEFFLNDRKLDDKIGILKMLVFDTCRTNPFLQRPATRESSAESRSPNSK